MSYDRIRRVMGWHYTKGQAARSIVTTLSYIEKKINKEETKMEKLCGQRTDISMVYARTSPLFSCSEFRIVFLRCSASSRLRPSYQSLVAKQIKTCGGQGSNGRHGCGVNLLKLLVLELIWRNWPSVVLYTQATRLSNVLCFVNPSLSACDCLCQQEICGNCALMISIQMFCMI